MDDSIIQNRTYGIEMAGIGEIWTLRFLLVVHKHLHFRTLDEKHVKTITNSYEGPDHLTPVWGNSGRFLGFLDFFKEFPSLK